MFDIGWSELVVIACVAILVVGPKDLPKMLRTFGKTISQLRRMAGDFQKQFDQALKEADIDEVKSLAKPLKTFQPLEDARQSMLAAQKSLKQSVEEAGSEPGEAGKKPEPGPTPKARKIDKEAPAADQTVKTAATDAEPAVTDGKS